MHYYLESDNSYYTRLQALAWAEDGVMSLSSINSSGGKLFKDIKNECSEKPLVVDCKRISLIRDHAFDGLKDVIKNSIVATIFINCEALEKQLNEYLGKPNTIYNIEEIGYTSIYGKKIITRQRVIQSIKSTQDEISNYIKKTIEKSFKPFEEERRLSSTPIISNGVFDARKIISDRKKFLWMSIFLADLVNNELDEDIKELYEPNTKITNLKVKDVRIIAVSIRASPIATSVALSIGKGLENRIEIVDHMGPKYKIIEEHNLSPKEGGTYIFIGDFIIGGTELKIASAYAHMRGGNLKYAFALGTVLEPKKYTDNIQINRLINLSECRSDLKYRFMQ